jgi:hypothetical protein
MTLFRMREIYESPLAAPLRRKHFEREMILESRRTKKVLNQLRFPSDIHSGREIISSGGNRALFILGGGASVNKIDMHQFSEIRAGYSIGINAWVSHDFVPDAYSFEADGLMEPPSREINAMSEALMRRAESHPETRLVLLRPKHAGLSHRMVKIPDVLRKKAFMYGRQNLLTRGEAPLRQDLGRLLLENSRTFSDTRAVIDNGASIVRLMVLGMIAGFREVVLVGIDLNSSPYFWEADDVPSRYLKMREDYSRPQNLRHDTLETMNRPYSNLVFVQALASAAREVFGTQILLGTEGSALAGLLPSYRWLGS